MNNKFTNFMMFIIGGTVGSLITWQYVVKKYEQIAQDEIDSVKSVYSKKADNDNSKKDCKSTAKEIEDKKIKQNMTGYTSKLCEQGYTNYSNFETNKSEKDSKKNDTEDKPVIVEKPYVISPDSFTEYDDYEKISLTYYSDQTLADDNDEIIDNIDEVVGFDSLNSFGQYEADSVFVRNDKLKCDYEILLDHRKYSDVVEINPHGVDY